MKILLILLSLSICFFQPTMVSAAEYSPPEAPSQAQKYMPEDTESFTEGLWSIVKKGISAVAPSVASAAAVCASIIGIAIFISCAKNAAQKAASSVSLIGTILVATLLIKSSNTMIHLGVDTVKQISDYGKLLIPVMTGALAAQGGVTSSAALYTGTAVFSAFLSSIITNLLAPMLYIYLVLSVANAATSQPFVGKLRDFIKWLATWGLKISLYVFTGYMGITGVVSGSADAAKLKATKLTISGMVPVVGGILSDASESILVSAGLVKSTAGVYGLLTIGAIWIEPFLKIGVQYLLLKSTAAACEVFDAKQVAGLVKNFSTAMGLVLAMTGAVCLMLLISIVCFMKGVS